MKRITRGFNPSDRYVYDFGKLTPRDDCGRMTIKDGWAQLDSGQDASYFGQWTNPFKRMIFSYVEGDTTLVEFDTDEEYVEGLAENQEHDLKYSGMTGIDPGFNVLLKLKFEELGISLEYQHEAA